MPAETLLTVGLVKQTRIPGPRIESPQEIMAVSTGYPMERSIAHAYALLILWMEEQFGWERWRAYDLLTHVGAISVGYYAIGTVAAKVTKAYLTVK
jgi:acetamidase/formamidase